MGATLTLVGNLGGNPTLRFTQDGQAVCNFSLAINQGFGDKQKTEWVRVTVFGDYAEVVNQHLYKGAKAEVVSRRFQIGTWESNGQVNAQLEVIASSVEFLSPKPQSSKDAEATDEGIPF